MSIEKAIVGTKDAAIASPSLKTIPKENFRFTFVYFLDLLAIQFPSNSPNLIHSVQGYFLYFCLPCQPLGINFLNPSIPIYRPKTRLGGKVPTLISSLLYPAVLISSMQFFSPISNLSFLLSFTYSLANQSIEAPSTSFNMLPALRVTRSLSPTLRSLLRII